MKWLDELKKIKDEPAYKQRGIMPVGLSREDFDRLIEIVERAEWEGNVDGWDDSCPICKKFAVHANDCPYSDDWENR